ncbi:hypothetical protein FKM82_021786 [Ascaphus truei]
MNTKCSECMRARVQELALLTCISVSTTHVTASGFNCIQLYEEEMNGWFNIIYFIICSLLQLCLSAFAFLPPLDLFMETPTQGPPGVNERRPGSCSLPPPPPPLYLEYAISIV